MRNQNDNKFTVYLLIHIMAMGHNETTKRNALYLNGHRPNFQSSSINGNCCCSCSDGLSIVSPLNCRDGKPRSRARKLEFGAFTYGLVKIGPFGKFWRNKNGHDRLTNIPKIFNCKSLFHCFRGK